MMPFVERDVFDYDVLAPSDRAHVLACREEIRERSAQTVMNILVIGRRLLEVQAALGRGRFGPWIDAEFGWSWSTANRFMRAASVFAAHFAHGDEMFPSEQLTPGAVYALTATSMTNALRNRFLALAMDGHRITAEDVLAGSDDDGDDRDPEIPASIASALDLAAIPGRFSVPEWDRLDSRTRRLLIDEAPAYGGTRRQFTQTNDNVDWARFTWNPVTGCLHDCNYCYARDIAKRFYPQDFVPTFIPERLHAPRYTAIPDAACTDARYRRVFVGSMADLFGKWVPQEWIDAVFAEAVRAPEWTFLFLTKFPRKLAEQDWPDNAWVGTSVDKQSRVEVAEKSFRGVSAGVKWLSCEPMLERLTFSSLEMFDWVVVGGESSNSHNRAGFDPPWEWIEHLLRQARDAGCGVYFKTNLRNRPQELPAVLGPE